MVSHPSRAEIKALESAKIRALLVMPHKELKLGIHFLQSTYIANSGRIKYIELYESALCQGFVDRVTYKRTLE